MSDGICRILLCANEPSPSAMSSQQQQVPVPPPQMPLPPPHFSAAPGGYLYPPAPPISVQHPPYSSFMPWPPMGYPYPNGPPGGFMMPMPKMAEEFLDISKTAADDGHQQKKRKADMSAVTNKKKTTILENALEKDNSGLLLGVDKQVDEEEENNEPELIDDNQDSANPTPDNTFDTTIHDTDNNNLSVALLTPPAVPPLAMMQIAGYETYCTVPGRLTLLSNMKKYRVSIAEIQRRLAPPECLNASILGGILRKAKNKDGGRVLREQLQTYGVELTSGRRKQGPLTCFSSLVEEEAAQIAHDFNMINQKHYPSKEAAAFSLSEVQNAHDASTCRAELYYARKFLNRMLNFHRADRSPVADQQVKQEMKQEEETSVQPSSAELLDPELQRGLTNYSLLTHGFGPRVVQSVLDCMLSVVNEMNAMDKMKMIKVPAADSSYIH